METAEELTKRLNTTIVTEAQYIQLRDRVANPDSRGATVIVINDLSPAEVDAKVAERYGIGEGLVGVLPPYTGPAYEAPPFDGTPLRHHWEMEHRHDQKMRLVFVKPDPHPTLDDLAAVTFTPEVAIAQAKERHVFGGLGDSRAVGPITEIKAALMTAQEAYELLEHGTPPGPLGTVPGRLVCVVVIHGTFETRMRGPFVGDRATFVPPPPHEAYLFEVHDSRTGLMFWSGGHNTDIVLP